MPSTQPKNGDANATVVRVIDGDTIVADVSGDETTVRLLNIDTPETKHPDKPVECLGAEATEFTKSLLAPGDPIELAYDETRLDQYGRTLAGVYKKDSLVNADIAAAGLGVAVLFQPNERFYPEVLAAEKTAQDGARGLYGSDVACTVPAMVDEAVSGLDDLQHTVPATADGVGTTLAVVSAAIVAGKAKSAALKALGSSGDAVRSAVWTSRKAAYLPVMAAAMERANSIEKKLSTKQTALVQAKKEAAKAKAEAEAEAKAKAKAVAEAKANAEVKAERERKAAAKSAAIRKAADEKKAAERKAVERPRQLAPKQTYRAPVQKPKAKPERKNVSKSGYTGPRCYAPGGTTWKPC